MANRVVIGNARGANGLWVSKPGYDVLTAGEEYLLFSMGGRVTQILARGSITFPSNANGQTQNVPLSGTNGVTPMAAIWGTFQVAEGTHLVPIGSVSGVGEVWGNMGAAISLTSSNLSITMQTNLNYSTVFTYTLLLEA